MKKLPYLSGEVEFIKGRLQEAVQQGHSGTGWRGDPLLEVVFDRHSEEWQVIDYACSPPKIAVSKPYDGLAALDMIPSLCKKLIAADTSARSVVERIIARQDAKEEDAKANSIKFYRELAREELLPAVKFDMRYR